MQFPQKTIFYVLHSLIISCVVLVSSLTSTAQTPPPGQVVISNLTASSMQIQWSNTNAPIYTFEIFINNTAYNTYLASYSTTFTVNFTPALAVDTEITACVYSEEIIENNEAVNATCVEVHYRPIATVEVVYLSQDNQSIGASSPIIDYLRPQCNELRPEENIQYVWFKRAENDESIAYYHREIFCECYPYIEDNSNCIIDVDVNEIHIENFKCNDAFLTELNYNDCSGTLIPVITHYQNTPNPFTEQTNIHYELSDSETVSLRVYNISGQQVATLIDQEWQSAGKQQAQFTASDLPKGIYYTVLETPAQQKVHKMLKLD